MKRAKFSRAERTMMLGSGCLIGLLLVFSRWHRSSNDIPVVNLPNPQLPQPNAFDIYVQAGNMVVPCLVLRDTRLIPEMPDTIPNDILEQAPLTTLKSWLRPNQPALQTLRSGFAYPYLQPPSRSWYDNWPYRHKFRDLARLLAMESRIQAEQGDWSGASQSAMDMLRLGTDVPRGGPLAVVYTGKTIQRRGREQFWPLVAHLNLAQTRAALVRLKEIDARSVSYVTSLQEDKWSLQAGLLELMRKKLLWTVLAGPEDMYEARWHTSFVDNGLVMRHCTEIMDTQITNARRPFTAPQQPVTGPVWSWGDPVTQEIFHLSDTGRVSGGRIGAAINEAENALLLVALALRVFHFEHGVYPKQLTALVPHYLTKLPVDPFGGGEPLRYKLTKIRYVVADISPKVLAPLQRDPDFDFPSPLPGGSAVRFYKYAEIPYTLYSIGPDGKDNGGKAIDKGYEGLKRRYRIAWDSQGDVVAGVNF